jgi:hypothetical protein
MNYVSYALGAPSVFLFMAHPILMKDPAPATTGTGQQLIPAEPGQD